MHIQVQKWGNSLAFRIPRSFACDAELDRGTTVDLSIEDGRLVLTSLKKKFSLKVLLSDVSDASIHHETCFGVRQGLEAW